MRISHPVAEKGNIGVNERPDTTYFARLDQTVGAQPFAIDKCQIPLPQASDRAACQPFAVAQVFEQIAAAGQDAPSAFGFRKSPEMVIIAVSGQGLDDPENLSCVFLVRSEEHTSELQSLMRISYAVF